LRRIPAMHLSVVGWPVRAAFVATRTFAPLVVVAASIAVACVVGPRPHTVSVEPAAAPSDVLFYAHVLYGGDDAYLVDGKWYRPAASGWVVFTQEPIELELLRRTLEPPAPSWFAFSFESR
jgi:hypothetical protein